MGGYRVVRKLGEGERAEVFLGHAGRAFDGDGVAAIKVYRPHTATASIDAELGVLARLSSRHLVELRDLATDGEGRPCLILRRVAGPDLARILSGRGTISAGEAVTALAPVAGAVAECHRVGVVHGSLGLGAVLLDGEGAPVLARFGRGAVVGEPPSEEGGASMSPALLSAQQRVLDDRRMLALLAAGLLAHVPGADAADLSSWLREPAVPAQDGFPELLASHLFELAPAAPIGMSPAIDDPVPHRLVAAMPAGRVPRRAEASPSSASPSFRDRSLGALADGARIDGHPAEWVRARLRAALAPVRKPVWIAGGIGLGALVLALAVLGAGGAGSGDDRDGHPAVSSTRDAAGSGAEATASPVIGGDDPVAAATALLTVRQQCLAERSVGCLDGVDQQGSAALDADVHRVRELQSGGVTTSQPRLDRATAALVQRLGDSALVRLTLGGALDDDESDDSESDDGGPDGGAPDGESASPVSSALLVRTDGVWRIRDLTVG